MVTRIIFLTVSCLLAVSLCDLPEDYRFEYKIIDADKDYVYKDPTIIEDKLADKYGQCPIPTICFTNFQGCDLNVTDVTIVNCTHRSAGPYVPIFRYYAISGRTWDFDFSNNFIQTLDHTSFYTSDPTNPIPINLTRLDLSHNYIKSIAANTFAGNVTKQLTILDLSYNKLTQLEEGVFSDMPVLETLDLSFNALYSVDSMCTAPLPRIKLLNLEFNRVASLASGCFTNQRRASGELIKLNNNAIGTVNDCSYIGMNALNLDNNPFVCGCTTALSDTRCWRRNADDTFEKSTEASCYKSASSTCLDVEFSISYKLKGDDKYQISVKLSPETEQDATLYQYENFELSPDDPETDETAEDAPTLENLKISVVSSVSKAFNFTEVESLVLERSEVYSLCVNRHEEPHQTRCRLLSPPLPSTYGAAPALSTQLTLIISFCMFFIAAFHVPVVV